MREQFRPPREGEKESANETPLRIHEIPEELRAYWQELFSDDQIERIENYGIPETFLQDENGAQHFLDKIGDAERYLMQRERIADQQKGE